MRSAGAAVLMALAYYAGAILGIGLGRHPAMPSLLWPPLAVVTATLLLVPPRRWWSWLLVPLPAHVLATVQTSWPIELSLPLFIATSGEAVLAAAAVRWLSDAPARFDTLRRMTIFLVGAALLVPLLTSFVYAWVFARAHGDPYWWIWRKRLFADSLTEAILVPAIVMALTAGPGWLRRAPARRKVEAALLAVTLVLVTAGAFGLVPEMTAVVGRPVTPILFLVPVVLAGTMRFGPGGASFCLLGTAAVAISAAVYGHGPFAGMPPSATAHAVEILLVLLAVPLLCLGAVLAEHRAVRAVLAEQVRALHASEALQWAILGSLNTSVAVVDRHGRIIDVNPNWAKAATEPDASALARLGVGDDMVGAWRRAGGAGMTKGEEVASGILAVARGSRPDFAIEYPCHTRGYERWFALSVVRLDRPEGGAVASCAEITERKRTELEVERSRQELTHVMRVFMMGELTASLAHELNQPLTGILANAQAGLRFLAVEPPDLLEVRAILADIVDDGKRAGEVIQRLRDFLRKGDARRTELDLNALVEQVVRLVTSDAIIRNLTITLDLDDKPVLVSADRVQLQQVVLNLLLNAMEAMTASGGGERVIVVRTRNTDMQTVHVAVEDRGVGLKAGAPETLFEPFVTTKATGMGMGLAICRSIIEAYDGVIWAQDNPGGGATFQFALPAALAATA